MRVPSGIRRKFNQFRMRALDFQYGPTDGVTILEEDWDNLILLDACRYDVFEAVSELPGKLQKRTSHGSSTAEFLQWNFANRTAYDTVFVSSNAMIGSRKTSIDVYKLVGLWGETVDVPSNNPENNTDPRSVPDPEPVVEKAIEMHHRYPNKRLIVHFLPPHTPFLIKDGDRLTPDSPYRTYTAAREGTVSAAEIRAVYEENVRYVLEYVSELLETLEGKTVVTSDHGELLGEGVPLSAELLHPRWPVTKRHYFDYAHYTGIHEQALINVPWLAIDGERRRIVAADSPEGIEIDESAIESQLEALGYR